MEAKRSLSGREKFAYGIGAVGKDMVYMLSASYISIYFSGCYGNQRSSDRSSFDGSPRV